MIAQIMTQTDVPVTTPESPPAVPRTPGTHPLPETEPDTPVEPPVYEPAPIPVTPDAPDKDDDGFETCSLPDLFSGVTLPALHRVLSA